jgi:ribosomal protein S27AE
MEEDEGEYVCAVMERPLPEPPASMALKDAALWLYDKGFNVVPVGRDKAPLCSWKATERIDRGTLERLMEMATGIAIVAGPANQVDEGQWLIIFDIDRPGALERMPTLRGVVDRTLAWRSGPRCPRCGDKHLVVLEEGRRWRCGGCGAEFSIEDDPPRGMGAMAVIDSLDFHEYLKGTVRGEDVEILAKNYALIPPSLHPSGLRYEWIPNGAKAITHLDSSTLRRIMWEIGVRAGPRATVAVGAPAAGGLRHLGDADISRLVELLGEIYRPSHRQMIWLYASGWLAKERVDPRDAARILARLYSEHRDEDPISQRATALVGSYRKGGVDLGPYAEELEEILGTGISGIARDPAAEELSLKGISGLEEIAAELKGTIVAAGAGAAAELEPPRADGLAGLIAKCSDRGLIEEWLARSISEARVEWNLKDPEAATEDSVWEAWKELTVPQRVALFLRYLKWCGFRFAIVRADEGEEGNIYVMDRGVRVNFGEVFRVLSNVSAVAGVNENFRREVVGTGRSVLPSMGVADVVKVSELNPPRYLPLRNGVLDLERLELLSYEEAHAHFTTRLDVEIDGETLRAIREGRYNAMGNDVLRRFRMRFCYHEEDDGGRSRLNCRELAYFISSVGTWLSPIRLKHLAFLIGPSGMGKTTLLNVLTKSIADFVATTQVERLSGEFGFEDMIGKRVLASSERTATVIKDVETLNLIFGKEAAITAHRKFRSSVKIPSLNAGMLAMNDPPQIESTKGETLSALYSRLSIIRMEGEDRENVEGIEEEISPRAALEFLVWARACLERRGWRVLRRSEEEMREYMEREAWPLSGFWRDCIEVATNETTKGRLLYTVYTAWARENRLGSVMGSQTFYEKLSLRAVRLPYKRHSVEFKEIHVKPNCLQKYGIASGAESLIDQ